MQYSIHMLIYIDTHLAMVGYETASNSILDWTEYDSVWYKLKSLFLLWPDSHG